MKHKTQTKTHQPVALRRKYYDLVRELAEKEHRPIGRQLEVLIDRGADVRAQRRQPSAETESE